MQYDARGPYSPDDIEQCLAPGGHLEGMVALRSAGRIQEVSLGMNSIGFNEVLPVRGAEVSCILDSGTVHRWVKTGWGTSSGL